MIGSHQDSMHLVVPIPSLIAVLLCILDVKLEVVGEELANSA